MKKLLGLVLFGIIVAFTSSMVFAASYTTETNWFDTTNVNHVNTIGKNIAKANGIATDVQFKVTDNENMNTDLTATSEVVYIYNGNLKHVANDNELAAMIAHEIGHIVNGHNAKSSLLNNAIASINPTTTTEKGATTVSLLKTISSNSVSKENEKEADITAVDLLMNAKYNPLALISVIYKADADKTGGLLEADLSYEDRIMYIYDYTNYNYPEKAKETYNTDSYKKAYNLINANIQLRNQSKSKVAKVEKTQKKLQKEKLKRIKNMAKSTNPWSSAYSMIQLSNTTK